ncbi:MAG: preprotein translocase subunit SecG [Saprospiraceae bacterium]|jgi:preprotein translocase subunit SecG|nr:preprotein translocase subunit SecG [Saprospiraceae bacterium]
MLVTMSIFIAIVAFLLIASVLIQNPKGGGVDATFGAQANQMFGVAKSADLIEKITWGLAATLIILCVLTTFMLGGGTGGPEIQSAG